MTNEQRIAPAVSSRVPIHLPVGRPCSKPCGSSLRANSDCHADDPSSSPRSAGSMVATVVATVGNAGLVNPTRSSAPEFLADAALRRTITGICQMSPAWSGPADRTLLAPS